MVAKYQRKLQPGKEFDKYFPKADEKDSILHKDGNLKLTIKEMANIINKYSWQTEKIAKLMKETTGWKKGEDMTELLRTIWAFYYNHVQYQNDEPGQEQLRTPARLWNDRFGDCDCYTLSIGCILTCLGIPFTMRISKYKSDWQHVYIVVKDKERKKQFVLDCVLDGFNIEKPYGPDDDFDPAGKLDINIKPTQMNGLAGIPIALLSGPDNEDVSGLGEIGKWFPEKRFLKKAAQHRAGVLRKLLENSNLSAEKRKKLEGRLAKAEARFSGISGISDEDLDGIDDAEDVLDGVEEDLELEGVFDDEDGLGDLGRKKKTKRFVKRKAKKAKRIAKRRIRRLKKAAPKIIVAKKMAAIQAATPSASSTPVFPISPAAAASAAAASSGGSGGSSYPVQPGMEEYANLPAPDAPTQYDEPLQQAEQQMEVVDEQVNNAPEEDKEQVAEEGYADVNQGVDEISESMAADSPEAAEIVEEANEESDLEEKPEEVLDGILCGIDFEPTWIATDSILNGHNDEVELSSLPVEIQAQWLNGMKKHIRKTRNYIAKYPGSVANHGGAKRHVEMCDFALKNWNNPYKREKAVEHLEKEEERMSKLGAFGDADEDDTSLNGAYDTDNTIDGLDGKKKKKGKFWKKVGKGLKKVFKFAQKFNPLMIAARNGFLLASKLNFFKLALKLYPGFMSWEEAQKYGLKRDFWDRKKKAADKFAKIWEDVLGGKRDKLAKALQKGWKKKKSYSPKIKEIEALKGLGFVEFYGLGEPNTIIGTSIAAAATIIAALSKLLKKNGANDLPPGEEPDEEDKVESTTNAVKDVADAALDVADSMKGLLGVQNYIDTALDCAIDPVMSGEDFDEASIDGLGEKDSRAARRAERQAKRAKNKEAKKQKKASKPKKVKKSKKAKKEGADADDDSGEEGKPSTIEKVAQGVKTAGGLVSAANQLYKNKTGKDLIPGDIQQFAEAPDKFFSPEEIKAIEANDVKMKASQEEAGMFGSTGAKIAGAAFITGLVGYGLKMAFDPKQPTPAKPKSALSGTAKPRAKAKTKAKIKAVTFS
jgi:hypothetical protein